MDIIVALASGISKSALSVIRLSGQGCFELIEGVFSRKLNKTTNQNIYYGKIIDGQATIDEVVLLQYKNPYSFTGEDSVEIMCHGSMLIVDEIIALLLSKGARYASNGEFSSRSFLNGKIDLIQAESINDMINATTKEAKNISLMALSGEVSKKIVPCRTLLADLLANIEVNIDYPEYEDIEEVTKKRVVKDVGEALKQLGEFIDFGQQGRIVKEGVTVAIVGKPNVGKSSLLNAIIKQDKAIVTSVPGTTRDVVEGEVNLNGILLRLLDTAGIRESDDEVESIGITKSIEKMNSADLVIAVFDESNFTKEDEELYVAVKEKNSIIVYNKADKIVHKDENKLYISALNNDVEPLLNQIKLTLGIDEIVFNTPTFANAREIGLLKRAHNALIQAQNDAELDLPIDLVATSLIHALNAIEELTGESKNVDITKEIFSRFCVGK